MKELDSKYFNDVRGVVYIPTQAYNAYQMWRDYSHEVAARDLGYAVSLNLNSLRIWLSYEFWQAQPEAFEKSFEDFLSTAAAKGLTVMPSLFECCGREPSIENIKDTNPLTGTAVKSPGTEIEKNPNLWDKPFGFIDWFMTKYKNDERLLAIEITNEPRLIFPHEIVLAQAMLKRAVQQKGSIPLTIGSITISFNIPFIEYGIDILQTHENFCLSEKELSDQLETANAMQDLTGMPLWVTEWQRIRTSSKGWINEPEVDKNELMPKHSTMAGILRNSGIGNFLWSLMLKPAYLVPQRNNGAFSGIFHEDGTVYSIEDAIAVSGNEDLDVVENNSVPEMFKPVYLIRNNKLLK